MKNVKSDANKSFVCGASAKPIYKHVSYGGTLCLSNPGQLELLLGMQERRVPLRTPVRGFSMFPFIRDFDVLTITPVNDNEPRLGEIAAFILTEMGKLAIHRIIARQENRFLFRGDNCTEADGMVALEQIIGRVTRVERRGREVKFGLKLGIATRIITWLSAHNLLIPLITLISAPLHLARAMRKT